MLYYSLFPQNMTDKDRTEMYRAFLSRLPRFRQEAAEKTARTGSGLNSAAAYLLLLYGLEQEYPDYLRLNPQPEFTYGVKGKPSLKNQDRIYFNLSHCNGGIALALSDKEIGIDIMEPRRLSAAFMKREAFAGLSNAEAVSLWTIIEAAVKLEGGGISSPDLFEMADREYREKKGIYTDTFPLCRTGAANCSAPEFYLSAAAYSELPHEAIHVDPAML